MQSFFLVISLLTNLLVHDIHISVTEITEKEDHLEVVCKIFLDDLQNAMGLIPGEELPDDYKGSDDLIQRFIDSNLIVKVNDQDVKLNLKFIEPAIPAVWATFETPDLILTNQNTISVVNKIMIKLFDDQKNILKIKIKNLKEEKVFDTDYVEDQFKF